MDLSQLSDEDLKRLSNNDFSKLSDDAKTMFKQPPAQNTQPDINQQVIEQPATVQNPNMPVQDQSMLSQAGDFAMNNIVTPAVGAAQTAVQYGLSNPVTTGIGLLAASKYGVVKNLANQGINAFQTSNLSKLAQQIGHAQSFGQDTSAMEALYKQQADKLAAQAAAQNQPGMLSRAGQAISRAGQAVGQGATRVAGAIAPAMEMAGPLSMLTAPYMMAAQEQNKIRQNPNAPGLENNPYAQVQRGEFQTQGQAGASNQRQAMVNMPYGNVSPQEKALLDARKQQQLDMMMRINAAKRVLGQQQ
jgi:hypothetical protein